MLQLAIVCLVIAAATVICHGGSSDNCRRPPTVDPRTCCNITKSFEKSEYPECFSDDVISGAGGFRGSNRQRRAAWGGYGGNWAHHGHDEHDYFHHGPHGPHGHHHGFHGDQDGPRGGERNGERNDDQFQSRGSNVYRGSVKYHNSGARGRDQDDESQFRRANLYDANWRTGQREFGDTTGSRQFARADHPPGQGGVNLGAFSCQIDCYLSKTKILENNVINRQIAIEKLKNIFTSVPQDAIISAIDKCANRVNTFTSNGGLKPDLPLPLRDAPGNCAHTGGFFLMCIHHEIFLNCPADNWNGNNDECNSLKDFVEKCRPSRRVGADGAPPS